MALPLATLGSWLPTQTSQESRFDVGDAGKGFHRRMSEIGRFVNRFDLLCCRCESGFAFASSRRNVAGCGNGFRKNFADCCSIQAGVLAFVPLDDQRLAAFHRSPCIVGDDCDTFRNLDDVLHAWRPPWPLWHRSWRRIRRDRTARNNGVEHSRPSDVERELRLACDFFRSIETLYRFANDFELRDAGFSWMVFAAGGVSFDAASARLP